MFRKYSRVISAVILGFFTWTSGGLFSVAHAAVDSAKKSAAQAAPQRSEGAEEKFAKLTEELTADLHDQKASHEQKKQRLSFRKGELDTLDTVIRAEFAATEQKLKAAKLPSEILARHAKFVKHYDDNLNELKRNIAQVESAKDAAETETALEKTRQHLAKVRAPSRHQKLDPNNLPHRQPKVIKREPRMKKEEFDRDLKKDKHAWKQAKRVMIAANGSVAGLLPSDDLAETIEVQLTPEIKAKALELGNNPVKIYEWVRNNFKYEPYYGSLKGSQQTFLEMSGNDYDQASLLIALLRSANIPAKYVTGTIQVPIDRVMSWLGVKDPTTAANIIASGGIPAMAGISEGKISSLRMEHVWVEAFVNMYPSRGAKNGPGNAWTPLDPSFKEQQLNTSVDMSKLVPFNETAYLSSQNKFPPSLAYLFALEDYHTANYTGAMNEMFYLKKIKEHELGILPGTLPYKTVVTGGKFASIGASARHSISIVLRDPATDESATTTKNVCELTGKKLTVSYAPASDQDSATVTNYGGLLKTPAYLIKVKAVVKIDDAIVLEGPPVSMGDALKLSMQFSSPGRFGDQIETDIAAGVYYTVALSALNVADKQAIGGLDNSENLIGTFYDSINSADDQVGKVLHNIGLQYFTHTNNASRLLEGVMHMHNTRAVNAGFVSVSAKYREIFGVTVSPPIIAGLNIDIPRYIQSPFSITGDMEQEKAFSKIQGLSTSYFEHAIWESFTGIDSVSTVKLLQLANEAGQSIYTINSANINSTLPLLNQSQSVKEDIQNVVAAGKEVTIPGSNITRNEWTGTGYMVRNPGTGEGAYMISSGLAGGGSTRSPGALSIAQRHSAVFVIGKPSRDLSKENDGFYLDLDRYIVTNIGFMLLGDGYVPKFDESYTSSGLLNLVNNKSSDVWIFNYSGHGNAGFMAPLPGILGVGGQKVYAGDIHADTHIAFVNSCSSGIGDDFLSAFGIDQVHQGQQRDEVFLGWNTSVNTQASSGFGYYWWRYMLEGESAVKAAEYADRDAKYEYDGYDSLIPILEIKGNPDTRLY